MSAPVCLANVKRVRREKPTRPEGFVDASFAFALTRVVVSLGHALGSVARMLRAAQCIATFATCFLPLAGSLSPR